VTVPRADRDLEATGRQLIEEYFFGLDDRDYERATRSLVPDARCAYGGVELPPGREPVAAYLRAALDPLRSTRHVVTSVGMVSGGERPKIRTFALAYVVRAAGDAEELQVRGLTYDDELTRIDGRWWVAERRHEVGWASTAPAEPVTGSDDGLVSAGVAAARRMS
jgi:hypothetical protein